ncbi:hypothetical protein SAMN05421858_3708 [Haladaptatus litoreus]|uniref:Uncharacterized protein n=1 Tax=Haladaptatus litoreus TaxID=553468 RepID=A0A1N7DKY4_9EURY|nr:hypothetical protein SAMN05421858_3708 [Haladaptatus litoreus]
MPDEFITESWVSQVLEGHQLGNQGSLDVWAESVASNVMMVTQSRSIARPESASQQHESIFRATSIRIFLDFLEMFILFVRHFWAISIVELDKSEDFTDE